MSLLLAVVLLTLATLGLSAAVAVTVSAVRMHEEQATPQSPPFTLELRVAKANQVLDALVWSGHESVRAGAAHLRGRLAGAAARCASMCDSAADLVTLEPSCEEELREVLVTIASLSALSHAPESVDLTSRVEHLLDSQSPLQQQSLAPSALQMSSTSPAASGVW